MKKILTTGLALLALASAQLRATEYVFENFDATLLDSGAQPWTVSLNLELGSFINGFNPTAANRSDWLSNWVSDGGGYYDPSGPEWAASLVLTDNSVLAQGSQLFLWAFDSLLGSSAENALFTDAAWLVGLNSPLDLNVNFLSFSGQTTALVGSFDAAAGLAATAGAPSNAVPEPTAVYESLVGIAFVAFAAYRRSRGRSTIASPLATSAMA